jgi:hypothetical protein
MATTTTLRGHRALAILGLAEHRPNRRSVRHSFIDVRFNNYDGLISTFTVKTGTSAASRGRRGIGERL